MYKILNLTRRTLHRILPYNETFDYALNYIKFLEDHKRFPCKKKIFNDYLYNIKNSNEILDPLRQFISDKYLLKSYVKSKVGDKYNVPTVAVFTSYEEMEEFKFPENCCIKPTNASQAVILRKNNEPINIEKTKEWFKLDYYKLTRERNYKYLKPMVIIEPLIFDSKDLMDYRFFCYNGKVKLICIDIGKYSGYKRIFYDRNWKKQDFSLHYPIYEGEINKPSNLNKMLEVAEILSSDFNFIRIDLYSDGINCLVGEITNCHAAASQSFIPLTSEKYASEIIFGDQL
ncbi:ATP-grasp fold amidoligase family protein [Psychrobacter namhaensis]|uniref:ATP-grasp fold amidoligase family protein n=1 Tax=Psychrobacter namhaensis TaxID=292734 RepID=UPI003D0316F3